MEAWVSGQAGPAATRPRLTSYDLTPRYFEVAVSLPTLSHLQFKVLALLVGRDERAGLEIRAELGRSGTRQSGPAFYQMMARLEDAGLAEGWYVRRELAGQGVQERRYRLTPAGLAAWRNCRDFYLAELRTLGPEEGLAGA